MILDVGQKLIEFISPIYRSCSHLWSPKCKVANFLIIRGRYRKSKLKRLDHGKSKTKWATKLFVLSVYWFEIPLTILFSNKPLCVVGIKT